MIRSLLASAFVAATSIVFAQVQPTPASVEMPQIQENAKPAPGQETGMMSGDKPFSLTTGPYGEIINNFNEQNELESITAKKDVIYQSEDMTINCDQLDYDNKSSKMVCQGRKVVTRQGEVISTCQLFKYFPNDQHSELTGNPIIYNKSADGKVRTQSGEKIHIYKVNGKPQIKIIAGNRGSSLNSAGNPASAEATPMAEGSAALATFGNAPASPAAGSATSGQSKPLPTPAPSADGTAPASTPAPAAATPRPNRIDLKHTGTM